MSRLCFLKPGRAFTRVELLAIIALVGTLIGLLMPAVLKMREAAARSKCADNLREMGIAVHKCNDVIGMLPPTIGWFPNYDNKTGGDQGGYGSFFWHLLPFLGEEALWKSGAEPFRVNPTTGKPATVHFAWNQSVVGTSLKTYACPSDPTFSPNAWPGRGSYVVNYQVTQTSGANACMPATFQDGTFNTLLITERLADCGCHFTAWMWWGSPNEPNTPCFAYSPTGPGSRFLTATKASECVPGFAVTPHGRAGINVAMCDGSARTVNAKIDAETWWAASVASDWQGPDW
jgi:prepilin-type processing-associated H-X9-DG protein